MKSLLKFLPVLITLGLLGCKPDKVEIEIYSSDIEKASNSTPGPAPTQKNEVVRMPIIATFSMLGEDDEGVIPKASEVAKKYLDEGAEFIKSKGETGDILVIKSTIPMGTIPALKEYLATNPSPIALVIENNKTITLIQTRYRTSLNNALNEINPTLGFELPAKSTFIKIIGDTSDTIKVNTFAVFEDGKAAVIYEKSISRRQSANIEFKGDDGSVYSQCPLSFASEKMPLK